MSLALSVVLSLACLAPDAEDQPFKLLATFHAPGGSFSSTVGPGPTPGSERLYTSYLYLNDTVEIVAVDPATGAYEVFSNPARGEYGSRAMVLGPDGNIYVATLPHGHLLRLDPRTKKVVDLGQPCSGETFIWDIAFAPDGRLYGGTQPSARLFRYDPATGKLEDLVRVDPTQAYARFVMPGADGFVYVGVGSTRMNVAAYEVATGAVQTILPASAQTTGFASVFRAEDGAVYATAGAQSFKLAGFTATPVDARTVPPRVTADRLRDGRRVRLDGRSVVVTDPATRTVVRRPYGYPGRELPLYRIAFGPDGRLYGSSVLPAWLLRLDEARGELEPLGPLGDGEVYQFVNLGKRLVMGAYGVSAPVLAFDPAVPFEGSGSLRNPAAPVFPGGDPGWRPQASLVGPDGTAYLGATPGYGKLGGPLVRWDGAAAVEVFPAVVPEQSITALARWGALVVGGTSIQGGGGTTPTQDSAVLFVWNPATGSTERTLVPVPRAGAIENLVVTPAGLAYGIAAHSLFVVDLAKGKVVHTAELPFRGGVVYAGMALGPDGGIWGLASAKEAGVFRIQPGTHAVSLVARAPEPITAGFGLKDGELFFASGARVYRYRLPAPSAGD